MHDQNTSSAIETEAVAGTKGVHAELIQWARLDIKGHWNSFGIRGLVLLLYFIFHWDETL